MATKGTRKRRKQAEPKSRGLSPAQVAGDAPPASLATLAREVEDDGGAVIGTYREPLGGSWQLFVALPIDAVEPTPFQRDLSQAHLKRLVQRIDEVGRFLDPIVAVRRGQGRYWTPNGNHRLHALRELGGRSIVALLVPEAETAYKILALNTEKAHNLREKALEVIRMARDLAAADSGAESDHALIFEEPALLTLGICYERNGRFSGAVYRPVLLRTDEFLSSKLARALALREERAGKLAELDEAVAGAVAKLKERGFESPYLKNFVVARINPLRFQRGAGADFDETLAKMLASARKFDAAKIKADQLAAAGGAPAEE
jgi:ParB family chromosome partitioning protein